MCPVIRINDDVYARLEKYAVGFDNPSNVIERILDQYESSLNSGEISPIAPTETPQKSSSDRMFSNSEIQKKVSAVAARLKTSALEQLCEKKESKRLFGLSFPLFVRVPAHTSKEEKKIAVKDNGVNRWTWKYEFEKDGYIYAICTQWFASHDELVLRWLKANS